MDILPAEGRLDHRSRSAPDIPVTNDQAVAEQHLDAFETRSLDVPGVPPHQYPANGSRVVDEVRQPPAALIKAGDIAELVTDAQQRVERFRIDPQFGRLARVREAAGMLYGLRSWRGER